MAEVNLKARRSVRVSEVIQAQEGETELVVKFPEPVPQGKVLHLRVEVAGHLEDAEPQA
ncbi:MAG: hypothetical protein ACYSU0_12395 [Planctomycetota bacterium]|jgi:hypothetical protein